MENKKITVNDIIGKIMTDKVEISEDDYKKMIKVISQNYNANNKDEMNIKMPSLRERRKRIQMNYYGQNINMLFQILSMQSALVEQFNNLSLLVETIAEKNGIELQKVKSTEDKALEAAQEYLIESAKKKRAEREALEKKNNIISFKK